MKVSTEQRIAAPLPWVWDRISEFPPHAKALRARGVKVERIRPGPGAGASWRVAGAFRGKRREGELRVARFEPPRLIGLEGTSGGMTGASEVLLAEDGPGLTRMTMWIELEATNLAAKLLLGTLTVARGELQRRFEARLAGYAAALGEAYEAEGPSRRPSTG